MLRDELTLDEIYSCTQQGLTGPVRLMQLDQLWHLDHRSGIQPSPRKTQKSFGFDSAGHLAVGTRGLATTWTEAVEQLKQLRVPQWPSADAEGEMTNDERLARYAYTLFDLGNSLPASLCLVVVNTQLIRETWLQRQLRIDALEQSEAHQRRLRLEKAHRVDQDWLELKRELQRTGIDISSLQMGRGADGELVIKAGEFTRLLMHLNGPAHPLHAHKEYNSPTIPAVNTGHYE